MHLYEDVTAKYYKHCIICGLISRSECNLATEDAKRVNETQKSFLKNFHILTWKVIYLFIMCDDRFSPQTGKLNLRGRHNNNWGN